MTFMLERRFTTNYSELLRAIYARSNFCLKHIFLKDSQAIIYVSSTAKIENCTYKKRANHGNHRF